MSSKPLRRWPAEAILKFGGLASNYDRKRGALWLVYFTRQIGSAMAHANTMRAT
jgi:hypothetical protein